VCLDPVDAVLIGALCRGLAETSARAWREGEPPPSAPTALLRLAMWRAGKSGVDGPLLDPVTGRPRPAPDVIDSLVAHVSPELEAMGDLPFVREHVAEVKRRGNGARHQRLVMERTGSLTSVVKDLADASCPSG
jgi:carboxylate-amine ligase